MPPPKDSARHGMEYTIRFAFKRDGEIIAPPRVTYSSHDAPADVRDLYRDAVNAALGRCTPLHLSDRMGRAVAGRPIALRFRGQPDHRRRKVAAITATMSLRRLLAHHCLRHDLNPGRVPPFILAKAKSAVSYLDARLIH